MSLKEKFLKFVMPFTIWMSDLHFPWRGFNQFLYDFYEIENLLRAGDAICTRSNWHVSNFFNGIVNPGKYMHIAMYVGRIDGKHYVIDVLGRGVFFNPLNEFLADKDLICIRRPKNFTLDRKKKAVRWMKRQVGKPYDYLFNIKNEDALYCSEAYYAALKYAKPDWEFVRKYKNSDRFTPNDVAKANNFFSTVYEKKVKK